MLVCNLNNNRSRPMAWMRESVWSWHLVHTDTYAVTEPEFGVLEEFFENMQTNFGNNNNEQCPNGPNKDLCMENLGGKLNTNLIDHW